MDITLNQALKAEEYVRNYIESKGADPDEVMMTPDYEKYMPGDVQNAIETFRTYWRTRRERGEQV